MSMTGIGTTLYQILITPIEYMIEVFFTIMYLLLEHEGYAIIAVSLLVSTLVLPLYLWADRVQAAERKKQKSMEKWLSHIRHNFHGDESYLMVNTYYREQNYRPIYTLRGLVPLFLQIPFFIAAFHFLSNMQRLRGLSFGPITDLGAPDDLLQIGGISVHLLPILMTFFNILSTMIYTKGFSFRQKLQPYLLALLFLVLLYPSPSGLVLYWTMNNLYSLCKNLLTKYVSHPLRLVSFLCAALATLYIIYLVCSGRITYAVQKEDFEILMFYGIVSLCLLLPLLIRLVKRKHLMTSAELRLLPEQIDPGDSSSVHLFFTLILCLTIFYGLKIPLLVISASPMDFLLFDSSTNPLHYAAFCLSAYIGLFLVWGSLVYLMLPKRYRDFFTQLLFFLLIVSLMNTFFFQAKVGYVSTMLEFDTLPLFSKTDRFLNMVLTLLLFPISFLLYRYAKKLSLAFSRIVFLTILVMSLRDVIITNQKTHEIDSGSEEEYIVPLSSNGRNIILIMLDRGVSGYIPFFFDEKPELKEKFAGFTYYPNTISYGDNTRDGAPALYGGYDYDTGSIRERTEDILDIHKESLCVLPRVFGEAGFLVTVTDPAFAEPEDIDYSIFDPYPYISAYSLEQNLPTGYNLMELIPKRERNFFFYSLYRSAPAFLQKNIYDTGGYLAADRSYFFGETGYRLGHTVLKNLPAITRLENDGRDRYLAFTNNTAHSHTLLTLPDYEDTRIPDYTGIDITADRTVNGITLHFDPADTDVSVGSYHTNMSAMLGLANWFDYLREIGIWDNCRIVLVSDHGSKLTDFEQYKLSDEINVTPYNPLLMVKDFDCNTPFTVDMQFMTNADVPALLTSGVIKNPVNPFTGHPIDMSGKSEGAWICLGYTVHDNIFDIDNWTLKQ